MTFEFTVRLNYTDDVISRIEAVILTKKIPTTFSSIVYHVTVRV